MHGALTQCQAAIGQRGWDAVFIAAPEGLPSVNVRYLSGFSGSSGYLLVGRDGCYLLTDFRYTEQAAKEALGWTVVRHGRPYTTTVADIVRSHGWRRVGYEADKVPVAMYRQWEAEIPATFEPMDGLVEDLRLIKTPAEVAAIRRAAETADRAVLEILPTLRGRRERDAALDLEMAMRRGGAERLAFSTIVVSGVRGSLPHGQPSDKVMETGELVTIDFGAMMDGYHSDETITVALGQPAPKLREMFRIVQEAQQAGISRVAPGTMTHEVDAACREVIARAGYGDYFGHGTGHGVGLQVHENPFASALPAPAWRLAPGMTLTVEPGIYVPGVGGVRLEDTLVVTETGAERLTGLPKDWQTY